MLDPITIFREGGPFLQLLLLCGMTAPLVFLVAFVSALYRVRWVASLWLAWVAVPFLVGLVGTWWGLDLAEQVIGFASLRMRDKMAASGLSVSLYTLLSGALLSALWAATLAFLIGLGSVFSPGVPKRTTLKHGVAGALVVLLSLLLVAFGSLFGGLVALLAGLGLVLVAARFPTDGTSLDATRLAGARSLVGVLSLWAFAMLLVFAGSYVIALLGQIRANASMESSQQLTADAIAGLPVRIGLMLLGGILVGVSTGVSVGSVRASISWKKGILASIFPALLWIPSLLLLFSVTSKSSAMWTTATPASEVRTPIIEAAGLRLPVYEGRVDRLFFGPVLQFSPQGITFEGNPADENTVLMDETDAGDSGPVVVEADRSTPLAEVIPFAKRLTGAEVRWTVLERRSCSGQAGIDRAAAL